MNEPAPVPYRSRQTEVRATAIRTVGCLQGQALWAQISRPRQSVAGCALASRSRSTAAHVFQRLPSHCRAKSRV